MGATLLSHLLNRCRWINPMGAGITDAMIKRQIFPRVVVGHDHGQTGRAPIRMA